MPSIHLPHDHPTSAASHPGPARGLVFLMATGAGLGAASLYYTQPMLGMLATDLGASAQTIGWVPTLTQLGYALGILFLAPLGDRHDRRTIILVKAMLLTLTLLVGAMTPSLHLLLAVSLVIGLTATLAQDIVPAAAALTPDHRRGQVVGTVMTGLLTGILLSRVVSGLVAEHFGWRTMFLLAALGVAALGVALWRGLPRFEATTQLPYQALLRSLAHLLQRHRGLRRAALSQGLLSVGFSAFWSTLAVMLHGAPFHLGSAVAGAFGLAGAAGALIAPVAGRLADRHGPERVTRLGTALTAVSFGVMSVGGVLFPTDLWPQMAALVLGTIGFDLGIQASLIAHQTIIYGLEPAARSRLNAVLMSSMFIGMASGSALGSAALVQWGWPAVTALATIAAAGAWLVRVWPHASARR